MEITLKLAIETYAELKGVSFDSIAQAILNGDEVIYSHIVHLMVSVA